MAKTHRILKYENAERKKMNLTVPWMSKKLYELDKAFGKKRLDEIVWTYGSGMTFRDCTKSEMDNICIILNCGKREKTINEFGVKFTARANTELFARTYDDEPITLSVEFKYDLPDSCEIEYVEGWEERKASDVKIEDGKFLMKTVEAKVNCNEQSMVKAIFNQEA